MPPEQGNRLRRVLLADTGAGSVDTAMELILSERDCRQCGVGIAGTVQLGGALTGRFATYWVNVQIVPVQFTSVCIAVAVPEAQLPLQVQGIACFRFLNRFAYGNFGDPTRFGLE
jgi:hypothetical protein